MNLGLKESDLLYIIDKIKAFKEIDEAVVFGSRAKGNSKPGSDVDLAIYGEEVNFDIVSRLHSLLEDQSPLPYFFDIVDATHLTHQDLKAHIQRVGKVIFKRD